MNDINWQKILSKIESLQSNFEKINEQMAGNIALFGAGQFGISAVKYLKKHNYEVVCFIDNSPSKQKNEIENIPVFALDNPQLKSIKAILITAKHAVLSVQEQLCDKYCSMSFDAWFVIKNIDNYENIRNNILRDERSKECLDVILFTMLTGNEKFCASITDFNQYFCLPQFVNTGIEYFIDAGAYVGDTIEKFIWAHNGAFKHIYAFEPGETQFVALTKRKERLVSEWALNPESISLIRGGLADKDGDAEVNLSYGSNLLSTSLTVTNKTSSNPHIKIFSLDNFIKDIPVTFIKADIEGMEIQMLKGAKETIKRHKPKMALSTYHEPADLFEIIEIILTLVPEYRVELRHHSPMLMDTTLYCWVEK